MNAYIVNPDGSRTYTRDECVVFCRVHEEWGFLSNFARAPLRVDLFGKKVVCPSSEALYQAFRFPDNPEVVQRILGAVNAFYAKAACREALAAGLGRDDWDAVKVGVMRSVLRIKLEQHREAVEQLLNASGQRPIVELSMKDPFWGAVPRGSVLIGRNVLGRLWMEIRAELLA